MKIKFNVTPKEFMIVKDILEKYLQNDAKAWVFGSRAKSSSLVGSDLDLAIECQDKLELKLLTQIKIAFEDSRLPYRVDVVDMKAVKPYFKELIKDEMIVFPLKKLNKVPELRFPEFSGDWEARKLGDVSKISSGGTPNRQKLEYWNGTVPWITTSLINFNLISKSNEFITKEGVNKSSAKLFPKNTILIALYGQGVTRGKVAILDFEATTNQACASIIVDNKVLLYKYIFYQLQVKYEHIRNLSNDGGQKNLSGGLVKLIKINFPKIQEQQKIAAFLSVCDNKIEQLTQKKQLLTDYKKGVMQQIFSQEIRFKKDDGSDYSDWEVKKLGNILDIFNGYAFSSNEKVVNGIKWIKISNVGIQGMNNTNISYLPKNFIESHKKYILKKGDYVVALTRPILNGKLKIAKIDDFFNNSLLNQRVGKLKSSENNLDFLYFLFQKNSLTQYIANTIAGSDPPNLSPNTIKTIKVLIPSLGEQQKIANLLTEIDTKINQVEKQLADTQHFKRGLLQQMFV